MAICLGSYPFKTYISLQIQESLYKNRYLYFKVNTDISEMVMSLFKIRDTSIKNTDICIQFEISLFYNLIVIYTRGKKVKHHFPL